MIRAVIVDDEINSRELIRNILADNDRNIEVLGEANDVKSGVELINGKKPELIFLDIEMPGGDGFKVLDAIEPYSFHVIFVTGYDHYAIKAIKYAALDYVLKPIDPEDFAQALNRIRPISTSQNQNIAFLRRQLNSQNQVPLKIILPGSNGSQMINLDDIIQIEAHGNYTFFFMQDGQKKLASLPLSHYENLLPIEQFFRVHKSHIVNCQKVLRIEEGRTGRAFLEDGSAVSIAARRKKAFIDFYKKNIGK